MRVSLNGTNAQAGTNVQGRINKPPEMDSFSKSINNQIANAQKQLQELSENKDMSMEDKMKRRQEIQQQITNLNNQLRQHQIEQRKEKQEKAAKSVEKKEPAKKGDKGAGLSQASMTAIISADAAMSQAQVQGSVATRMEGRAGVLEAEIKLDSAHGGNVEAKQKELASFKQKADAAGASQTNTLASADNGVVYEKSDSAATNKATYSINKMSDADRAALVKQLKAEQANREQQLTNLVHKMMFGQAKTYGQATDMWKFLASGDYTVDAATKEQAQKDISEDGYWGVKQTSQRLFDFASALAGDNVDKMKEMQKAMEKGFKQATGAWGRELPSICQDTFDAANKLFDEYYATKEEQEEE